MLWQMIENLKNWLAFSSSCLEGGVAQFIRFRWFYNPYGNEKCGDKTSRYSKTIGKNARTTKTTQNHRTNWEKVVSGSLFFLITVGGCTVADHFKACILQNKFRWNAHGVGSAKPRQANRTLAVTGQDSKVMLKHAWCEVSVCETNVLWPGEHLVASEIMNSHVMSCWLQRSESCSSAFPSGIIFYQFPGYWS